LKILGSAFAERLELHREGAKSAKKEFSFHCLAYFAFLRLKILGSAFAERLELHREGAKSAKKEILFSLLGVLCVFAVKDAELCGC